VPVLRQADQAALDGGRPRLIRQDPRDVAARRVERALERYA